MTAGHAETPLCPDCNEPLQRREGEFYCANPDGFVLRDGAAVIAHAGVAEVGSVGTELTGEDNGDGVD